MNSDLYHVRLRAVELALGLSPKDVKRLAEDALAIEQYLLDEKDHINVD